MTAARYLTIGACVLVSIAVLMALVEVASLIAKARAIRRYQVTTWWDAWRAARRRR